MSDCDWFLWSWSGVFAGVVVGEVVEVVGELADVVGEITEVVGKVTEVVGKVAEVVGRLAEVVGQFQLAGRGERRRGFIGVHGQATVVARA